MTGSSDKKENIRISLDNSQITAGRDVSVTGAKKETLIENVSEGATVIVGANNTLAQPDSAARLPAQLAAWQAGLEAEIDRLSDLLVDDKEDIKDTVEKIKKEVEKTETVNPGRLERLLNSLAVMAPDIFEVAIATLAAPLSGIGLVMKKISEKAIEVKRQSSAEAPDGQG